jgi:hypothetical protein
MARMTANHANREPVVTICVIRLWKSFSSFVPARRSAGREWGENGGQVYFLAITPRMPLKSVCGVRGQAKKKGRESGLLSWHDFSDASQIRLEKSWWVGP